MENVIARKLKMSQLWLGEKVKPFTSLSVEDEGIKIFSPGDLVKIISKSKGRGFAGVVKRHHFRGGPATHGQSDRERAPGSIGGTTTPGRVYKGKRMAGHMGNSRVTIKTKVLEVDSEKKIVKILGGVPGHYGTKVIIKKV